MSALHLLADIAQVIGPITGIATTGIVLLAAKMFITSKPKRPAPKTPDQPAQDAPKQWQPSGLHQHRKAPTALDDVIERSWR